MKGFVSRIGCQKCRAEAESCSRQHTGGPAGGPPPRNHCSSQQQRQQWQRDAQRDVHQRAGDGAGEQSESREQRGRHARARCKRTVAGYVA